MDIKVEMYVSSIKELKKVLEEIKETKRNNPEEKFRFYIRVEKFGNCFCVSIFNNFVEIIFSHTHIPPFLSTWLGRACKDSVGVNEGKVNKDKNKLTISVEVLSKARMC